MFLVLCGLLLTGCADSAIHYKVTDKANVTKSTAVLWDEGYFCQKQCSDEELKNIFNEEKAKDSELKETKTKLITKTTPGDRLVGLRTEGQLNDAALKKYIKSDYEGGVEYLEFRYPVKTLIKDMEAEIEQQLEVVGKSMQDSEKLLKQYFDSDLGDTPLDKIEVTTRYESDKTIQKNTESINKIAKDMSQTQLLAVERYADYYGIDGTTALLSVYKTINKIDDVEAEKVINMINFMEKGRAELTDEEKMIEYKNLGLRGELLITMPSAPTTNFGTVSGNTVIINLTDTNLLKLENIIITTNHELKAEEVDEGFFTPTTVIILAATAIGFFVVLLIGINSKKSDINFYN